MGKFVSNETSKRIFDLMFGQFGNTPGEEFLKRELARYIPQMIKWGDAEIVKFVARQRRIYLDGKMPKLGVPIASLNPTFIDSLESIKFKVEGKLVYTRASEKENGFRMQLHAMPRGEAAFTRQFTAYDLRMFPELKQTLQKLPVMIGDVELVNKRHKHLAGFHRVEKRIPGLRYWPRKGSSALPENVLMDYFDDRELFDETGWPREEFELTLVFHGLFAIAHSNTWNLSRSVQAASLIQLCQLPIDYKMIDAALDQLKIFCRRHGLNARVVRRRLVASQPALSRYVEEKEAAGLEGVCVVQTAFSGGAPSFAVGKSFKIKKYETVDAALLGLYLGKKSDGLAPENIKGGLLGLFDESLGLFLPALKVNFDPEGPQIKTAGQRERLTALRRELAEVIPERLTPDARVVTLYDVFLRQGEIALRQLFQGKFKSEALAEMMSDIPRGQDLEKMFAAFGREKNPPAVAKFLKKHESFFLALMDLRAAEIKRFLKYFAQSAAIKAVSAKLVKPQVVLNLAKPIVMEAKIFGIKWGLCPFPAGFHTWFGNSFQFNNAFAERIRWDKEAITDYATIFELARRNTVKTKKRAKRAKK